MGLVLATLNLHCGLDRHGEPYSVPRAVAALDADVLVVQENWRPHGRPSIARAAARACGYPDPLELDLVTGTPLADLRIVPGPVPDETGAFGLAVLSRVPLLRHSTVALGAAPGDVVGHRYAQVVEIPAGDAVLRIVNVHLTHRLLHGPRQLGRLTRALVRGDVPTVIAGDLNMCRPTVLLAGRYRPSVRGRSWPAHRPVAQIDHVLTGPGVHAGAARVGPAVGSDHLPVRIEVSPARAGAPQPLTVGGDRGQPDPGPADVRTAGDRGGRA